MPTFAQDTGGQGYRIKKAFDRLEPSWEVRSLATKRVYIDWPRDMDPDAGMETMLKTYAEADVVHHRNNLAAYKLLDRDQGKPAVVHHQGTAYRNRPFYLDSACRAVGALQCVSTIDLELIHGHPWLPSPFDVSELQSVAARAREDRRTDGRLVVAHAPTNRAIKSTSEVISAVRKLQSRGLPVELDLIEGKSWAECLERKARADVYVDQLQLGYGNNAVECWLMGVPVVAGASDPAVLQKMRDVIGYLPFWEATEDTLVDRLRELVAEPELRAKAAETGAGYAHEFHDGRRTVAMLKQLWSSAPPTKGSDALELAERQALYPPRTGRVAVFKTSAYPALMIRIGERNFKFVGGRLSIDRADREVIWYFATRNPHYEIEEVGYEP